MIAFKWIKQFEYGRVLELQKFLVSNAVNGGKFGDLVLLVEHPPTFTAGRRQKLLEKQIDEVEVLKTKAPALGAAFFETQRGGLTTFHGPGQLVAYPIVNLNHFQKSINWYMGALEQTLIMTCNKYGIPAHTTENTGVWIGDSKIAAIGIHVSRWVTSHGIALNCNVDLKWFSHFLPCGIERKGVTSISQQLKKNVTIEEVIPNFEESFLKVFGAKNRQLDSNLSKEIDNFLLQKM